MIESMTQKTVTITAPVSGIGGSYTTTEVDTKGYDHCTIVAAFGAIGADVAALKVTESDESGTGHADVTGLAYGATGAPALPKSTTDNGKSFVFDIDLRQRKRYLDVVATAGAGATLIHLYAVLSRAKAKPTTTTERGYAAALAL